MNAYRSQIPILERELEVLTEQCAQLEAQAAHKAANIEHEPVFQQSILKGNRHLALFTLMAALATGNSLVDTQGTLHTLGEALGQCHAVLTERKADEVAGSARAITFRETCRALCSAAETSPPVVTEHEDNTSSEVCQ